MDDRPSDDVVREHRSLGVRLVEPTKMDQRWSWLHVAVVLEMLSAGGASRGALQCATGTDGAHGAASVHRFCVCVCGTLI